MKHDKYCDDALKLSNIKIVCGKDCPLFKNCPRLILEDATDEAINEAIEVMIEIVKKGKV